MNIKAFAEAHRLKLSTDECGERIVPGKQGQIYEYSDDEMGVMFMPPPTKEDRWGKWCPRRWGNFRRGGKALGMTVLQNGDSEGCLSFDPANQGQVKLAIKIAGVKRRRRLSDEQKAQLAASSQKTRFKKESTVQMGP